MSENNQKLTTAFGIPVANDLNSLTAGERGCCDTGCSHVGEISSF